MTMANSFERPSKRFARARGGRELWRSSSCHSDRESERRAKTATTQSFFGVGAPPRAFLAQFEPILRSNVFNALSRSRQKSELTSKSTAFHDSFFQRGSAFLASSPCFLDLAFSLARPLFFFSSSPLTHSCFPSNSLPLKTSQPNLRRRLVAVHQAGVSAGDLLLSLGLRAQQQPRHLVGRRRRV